MPLQFFHRRVNQILQKMSEIPLEALTLTLCSVHHTSRVLTEC